MSAKSDYLKGEYSRAAACKNDLKTIAYKIGGLVFVGQHQEARLLYKSFYDLLNKENQVIADFHLGVSYTRISEYSKGRQYFAKNLKRLRRDKLSPTAHFYCYQGASFYRYFFSQHRKSQRLAEKGYGYLLQMSKAPPLLLGLSLDIQAHNKVQSGHLSQGLKLFEKALEITERGELADRYTEIEISYILYQSEHSCQIDFEIGKLKKHLAKSKNRNDYSKSAMVLQIAKLIFLKGDFEGTNNFLNDHFDVIYKNQNKRKIATLKILMAQLMFYRGQLLEAFSLSNAALTHLDPEVDFGLYLPLLGINVRILSNLGKDHSAETKEIQKIIDKVDRQINHNIENRESGKIIERNRGDDPFGDLLDKCRRKSSDALQEVLKSRAYLLLYSLFDLAPSKKYILSCESENTTLLVGSKNIINSEKTFSKMQLRFLQVISQGPSSKQQLIEQVWGYEYDPLRHDSLIYTTVGRIRKTLEPYEHWIFSDENVYQLDPNVEIRSTLNLIESRPVEKKKIKPEFTDLNYRQLQTIAEGDVDAISVSDYGDRWSVTRMTALRDLKNLVERNLASKVGKGKATRYLINS